MINYIFFTEENYNKLKGNIKNDLLKLKADVEKGKIRSRIEATNVIFELESLLNILNNYTQYDFSTSEFIAEMSEQNKIRLIGYLVEKLDFPKINND